MLFLEGLDVFNIIHEVLDLLQHGQCFRRNDIPQVLFDLHSQLNLVHGVQAVISKFALKV